MKLERVLLVEDCPSTRFGVRDFLDARGIQVDEAETCAAARELYRRRRPDVAVVDHALPDGDGVSLVSELLALDAQVPLVVLTGHASVDLAVGAMRAGAANFLTKPVDLDALLVVLERAYAQQQSHKRQIADETRRARDAVDPFIGRSPAIRALADQARRLAVTTSPKLILGETGVGKGVLARWFHQNGPNASAAFVDLNCAGLSRDLLESELFGHERGAFTGAVSAKVGLLEVAHKGVLFLDELGEMDLLVQAKLLKVLEEKRFRRVGDVRDREVSVALIAATHRDLPELVEAGRFRSDLYFRVATVPIEVPPLRDRREDIPELARGMLSRLAHDLGRGELSFSDDATAALVRYDWPGNIRELRNVVERAALLVESAVIASRDLRFAQARPESSSMRAARPRTLVEAERSHIDAVLKETGGRVDEACRILGIPRSTLYFKIKKHGIGMSKV